MERKNVKRNKTRPKMNKAGLFETMTINRGKEKLVGLNEDEKKLLANGRYQNETNQSRKYYSDISGMNFCFIYSPRLENCDYFNFIRFYYNYFINL